MENKKVFVSGCFDLLHSGHVAFFKEASRYGDLYVGVGSDATVFELKHRKPICGEKERLYVVKAIRYVKDAFISPGHGMLDFAPLVERIKPDIFVVNEDGSSEEKASFCRERGMEYIVLKREPEVGLEAVCSSDLREEVCHIPYRIDLAGTWIDQPNVSSILPGWAITISIEADHELMERAGMSTSTRNAIRKIWPYRLPDYNGEQLAKLVFCFENDPEKHGKISGAQDSIGICMAGLTRHYYNGKYWPERIEQCLDEDVLCWLEDHIYMLPMFPRRHGLKLVETSRVERPGVEALTKAAEAAWPAILQRDMDAFAKAYQASFEAQLSLFPAMMQPGIGEFIDRAREMGAVAWKLAGAGGGGYLVVLHPDGTPVPEEALKVRIRRK